MSDVIEEQATSKQVDKSNRLWYKPNGTETHIGFTASFLEILHDCWHITPASRANIRKDSPLVTVETNDEQFTVPSPILGDLLYFNDKAMNFPDQISEEDIIFILGEKKKTEQKASKVYHNGTAFENLIWAAPQRAVRGALIIGDEVDTPRVQDPGVANFDQMSGLRFEPNALGDIVRVVPAQR